MALAKIELGPIYMPNPSIGRPISGAQIFIGIVDTDPEIGGNQKQVSVQEEDGTITQVAQPIVCGQGGVPLYQGSPVIILVDGDYSMKVLDSGGSQIYYVPKSLGGAAILASDLATDAVGKGSDLVAYVGQNPDRTVTEGLDDNADDIATNAAAIAAIEAEKTDTRIGGTMSNNTGDLVNDIDIEAATWADDLNTTLMAVPALTKELDAAWVFGDGGGLDTGTFAVDTWYYRWFIAKTDGSDADVLFSLSATAPTMPAGYTLKDQHGSIFAFDDSATPTIRPFDQDFDTFWWQTVIEDTVALTSTPTQFVFSVPDAIPVTALLHVVTTTNVDGNTLLLVGDGNGDKVVIAVGCNTDATSSTRKDSSAVEMPTDNGTITLNWAITVPNIHNEYTRGWIEGRQH